MPMRKRFNFQGLDEKEELNYCHQVYKQFTSSNSGGLCAFPLGLDELRFPEYRIVIQNQDGGEIPGPTIYALIRDILRADDVLRLRGE